MKDSLIFSLVSAYSQQICIEWAILCVYVCVYVYVYVYVCVRVRWCVRVRAGVGVRVRVCLCECVCICVKFISTDCFEISVVYNTV